VPDISPARRAAFRILMAVERGSAHADDLLRGNAVNTLSPADRNLATTLVLGVLRWQLALDHQLKSYLARPGAKLDREVLIALRLGAFQLLYLDRVPAHAVIGESVELVKQAGHQFASRMVNAVLRKLSGAPRLGSFEDFSAQSHPAWLVDRWVAYYGREAACHLCRHGQTQPLVSLRIRNPVVENPVVEDPDVEAELARAGVELAAGELLTAARTVVAGDVTATDAFRDGRIRIQDEGSQLIAELAACAGEKPNQRVKRILDACAAPGGKTLILAERHPEAHLVACEASPQRFAQMRDRLAAYAIRIECRLADATKIKQDAIFDLALADVPCSGTGTLGRNPEIRHRLQPEDFPRHAERQRAILQSTVCALCPGGRAVYSTCSLEPEENEQVVAEALAQSSGIRQISLETTIESLFEKGILTESGAEELRTSLTQEGVLRLLPGALHTDGFFIALLEKVAR
jgi:16S rRNA (cytosine967-C5)-methyltransferase